MDYFMSYKGWHRIAEYAKEKKRIYNLLLLPHTHLPHVSRMEGGWLPSYALKQIFSFSWFTFANVSVSIFQASRGKLRQGENMAFGAASGFAFLIALPKQTRFNLRLKPNLLSLNPGHLWYSDQ